LIAVTGVGGYATWALQQVPDFYADLMAAEVAPDVRRDEAKEFSRQASELVSGVTAGDGWDAAFTQRQVNSWFIEELGGKFADLLPDEARDPRVKIEDDAVLIGFQYTHTRWNGVVSFRVRPWVPRPNQLALEISDIKAGSLPIPLDGVLKQVGEQFETRGWRVDWRQHEGNDVLVVDFETGRKKRSVLESVQVSEGVIRVTGRKPSAERR
ncbi:MAG: hypothetical protein ACE5KM_22690, partial [Planctomycetaceae bacterium]